ncbi:unnamed protein product [Amoebophrya sp. A25]|nr:unnamed protein product [Amoebophrya sp. A25]|eukprot:GSA25T00015031001.1
MRCCRRATYDVLSRIGIVVCEWQLRQRLGNLRQIAKTKRMRGAPRGPPNDAAKRVIRSETHPLPVSWLGNAEDTLLRGVGLSMAPGKRLPNGGRDGSVYLRSLDKDLEHLRTGENVHLVVCLLSPSELSCLGVRINDYRRCCQTLGVQLDESLATVEMAAFSDLEAVHAACRTMAEVLGRKSGFSSTKNLERSVVPADQSKAIKMNTRTNVDLVSGLSDAERVDEVVSSSKPPSSSDEERFTTASSQAATSDEDGAFASCAEDTFKGDEELVLKVDLQVKIDGGQCKTETVTEVEDLKNTNPVPTTEGGEENRIDASQQEKSLVEHSQKDKKILIHCRGGLGRTGTLAACLWLFLRLLTTRSLPKSKEAIAVIRGFRPGSIESRKQEDCVAAFRKFLLTRGLAAPPSAPSTAPLERSCVAEDNKPSNIIDRGDDTAQPVPTRSSLPADAQAASSVVLTEQAFSLVPPEQASSLVPPSVLVPSRPSSRGALGALRTRPNSKTTTTSMSVNNLTFAGVLEIENQHSSSPTKAPFRTAPFLGSSPLLRSLSRQRGGRQKSPNKVLDSSSTLRQTGGRGGQQSLTMSIRGNTSTL